MFRDIYDSFIIVTWHIHTRNLNRHLRYASFVPWRDTYAHTFWAVICDTPPLFCEMIIDLFFYMSHSLCDVIYTHTQSEPLLVTCLLHSVTWLIHQVEWLIHSVTWFIYYVTCLIHYFKWYLFFVGSSPPKTERKKERYTHTQSEASSVIRLMHYVTWRIHHMKWLIHSVTRLLIYYVKCLIPYVTRYIRPHNLSC